MMSQQQPDGEATLDDLRQQGNYQFSEHNYDHAVALYTSALEKAVALSGGAADDDATSNTTTTTDMTSVILLCNRSAAFYCLGNYDEAKTDTTFQQDLYLLTYINSRH